MKKFFSLLLVFVMLASFACVNAESTDGPVTIELFYSPWGSTPS